ncbi:MAG: dihydrolipoamide acetyltransferase family protein [Gemmatimonadota bacterium]
MPTLGADMTRGTLVEWHVKPGDAVAKGQVVCTVETDKGAVEVECWEPGTVARLVAEPMQSLEVGAPLAFLAQGGETVADVAKATERMAAPAPSAAAAQPAVTPAPAPAPPSAPPPPEAHVRASPAARRRAEELGIALATVAQRKPGHAVSIADVERAAAERTAAPSSAPSSAGAPAAAASIPADRQVAMRHAIASAMARSKREIPHYYLGTEILLERASAWLETRNAGVGVADRVLLAAVQVKAVARAVHETPELNGFYRDGTFIPGSGVHVGIAVALRGGGLIAPALHEADTLPLAELMRRMADLIERARRERLRGAELTDATITITNLGDLGVETVFGVISPPQVALVGFGRVVRKPAVVGDAVVAARVVHATLSADHRVSDGMRGARFLAALDRLLQSPEALA